MGLSQPTFFVCVAYPMQKQPGKRSLPPQHGRHMSASILKSFVVLSRIARPYVVRADVMSPHGQQPDCGCIALGPYKRHSLSCQSEPESLAFLGDLWQVSNIGKAARSGKSSFRFPNLLKISQGHLLFVSGLPAIFLLIIIIVLHPHLAEYLNSGDSS